MVERAAERPVHWRRGAGPLATWSSGTAGERLVFVHGFTQGNRSWRPIADHFARRGHECVVVDLPGHGESADIRADLRTSASLLGEACGVGTYIGYSLGGRVCLHLALQAPHLVQRLALLGANPGITNEDERARRRAADDQLAQRLVEVGVPAFIDDWVALPLFAGLALSDADRAERLANTAEGLASSLQFCGAGTQLPLWDRLLELTMPVLTMAGSLDDAYEAICERVASAVPDGTFATIHGVGHAAHLQSPTQVITRLEGWLATTHHATL
jgi:2-succinyl-6-hydroxy-2,4-cyclohexadiene-1-carboxylate synthase